MPRAAFLPKEAATVQAAPIQDSNSSKLPTMETSAAPAEPQPGPSNERPNEKKSSKDSQALLDVSLASPITSDDELFGFVEGREKGINLCYSYVLIPLN